MMETFGANSSACILMVTVPYSGLVKGYRYFVPPPSDEARFLNGREDTDEFRKKLADVLSPADIVAQSDFNETLKYDEVMALEKYKRDGYTFMGPLLAGTSMEPLVEEGYLKEDPEVIKKIMAGFRSVTNRAPKLKRDINVFRGIRDEAAATFDGKRVLSTSWDENVARKFLADAPCCMLKINVKPNVRFFAWGEGDIEKEITILPPYTALVVDGPDSSIKMVTLTPVEDKGGTRRRNRRARSTRDPRYRKSRRRTVRTARTIRMNKKEYLREHHHLFRVLRNPTRRALNAELRKQKAELKERG
jgi:hypothetical protein